MFSLTGFQDQVFGFDHNYDGSLVAVVSKDKMLRIFDARSQKLIRVFFLKKQFFSNFIGYFFIKKKKKLLQEGSSHEGARGARVCWLGKTGMICTVGFDK